MSTNFSFHSMNTSYIPTDFYTALLEFLLSTKYRLIAVAASYDLTGVQAVMLVMLGGRSGYPMKRLGQLFHCDASNITGIIDGLEQKGLVARENDMSDRRIKTIAIRPAGQALRTQLLTRLSEDNEFLFAGLSNHEAEQFMSTIIKIAQIQKADA
jgi:DNA-binding MarR family transcriptional regulator